MLSSEKDKRNQELQASIQYLLQKDMVRHLFELESPKNTNVKGEVGSKYWTKQEIYREFSVCSSTTDSKNNPTSRRCFAGVLQVFANIGVCQTKSISTGEWKEKREVAKLPRDVVWSENGFYVPISEHCIDLAASELLKLRAIVKEKKQAWLVLGKTLSAGACFFVNKNEILYNEKVALCRGKPLPITILKTSEKTRQMILSNFFRLFSRGSSTLPSLNSSDWYPISLAFQDPACTWFVTSKQVKEAQVGSKIDLYVRSAPEKTLHKKQLLYEICSSSELGLFRQFLKNETKNETHPRYVEIDPNILVFHLYWHDLQMMLENPFTRFVPLYRDSLPMEEKGVNLAMRLGPERFEAVLQKCITEKGAWVSVPKWWLHVSETLDSISVRERDLSVEASKILERSKKKQTFLKTTFQSLQATRAEGTKESPQKQISFSEESATGFDDENTPSFSKVPLYSLHKTVKVEITNAFEHSSIFFWIYVYLEKKSIYNILFDVYNDEDFVMSIKWESKERDRLQDESPTSETNKTIGRMADQTRKLAVLHFSISDEDCRILEFAGIKTISLGERYFHWKKAAQVQ